MEWGGCVVGWLCCLCYWLMLYVLVGWLMFVGCSRLVVSFDVGGYFMFGKMYLGGCRG